jgi:hypothetical protein
MPRTEVYQLRLSTEEKIALAHEAKKRGVSIARMIRADYGLLEVRDLVEELQDRASENPEEVKAALLASRVNDLARTMPRANAERLARKELR